MFLRSLAAIQAQVKRELEAEKREAAAREGREKSATPPSDRAPPPPADAEDMSPLLAVRGVFFKCPLIGEKLVIKYSLQFFFFTSKYFQVDIAGAALSP